MTERTPPDSPHVRSGVSSFSHISSPQSYQFSRDGDASDEEGSSWSSDEVCNAVTLLQATTQHADCHCCRRCILCGRDMAARSCGDVIALLDSQDIWRSPGRSSLYGEHLDRGNVIQASQAVEFHAWAMAGKIVLHMLRVTSHLAFSCRMTRAGRAAGAQRQTARRQSRTSAP